MRIDDEMHALLETAWEQAHRTQPRLSRADLVRRILLRGLIGASRFT